MKGLIFTYALTYGGSLVALFNPWVGVLIYICFAIIRPEALWYWSVPAGNYSFIIAIALLAGWALNGFGSWKFGRANAVVVALVGFWLCAAVSALFCSDLGVGIGFLEQKGKIVLPVLVGLTLIHSTAQLRQLAWVMTLSQGYVALDLNLSYFQGFNRLQQVGFGGMDNNSLTIALVTGVGLAFFLGINERRRWKQLTALACAALMTHAVFFSFSRGGMLALLFVGLAAFIVMPKRPSLVGLFATGALVALVMAGPEVRQRFASGFVNAEDRDSSAQSRLDAWKVCGNMIEANPLTGVGPDHFMIEGHKYGLWTSVEAHSLWLQTAAEIGLPGVAFLSGFYLLTGLRLHRLLRRSRGGSDGDPFVLDSSKMVLASLAGFVVAAQFVSLEGLELPYYITLLGAGALKLGDRATVGAGCTASLGEADRQFSPVEPLPV